MSFSIPTFAAEKTDSDKIFIQSDGTYKSGIKSDLNGIKIQAKGNGIFQDDKGCLYSRVSEMAYIPVQKINIPIDNIEEAKSIIKKYHMQSETASSVLNNIAKAKTEHSIKSVNVYLPQATRTYKGYGNKTYYEETVETSWDSGSKVLGESKWGDYANNVILGVINFVVAGVADSETFGTYSIASIFVSAIPSSVSGSTEVTNNAELYEIKTAKHTYVVENGEYYFGSLTQASTGHFENMLKIPGVGSVRGKDSEVYTQYTPNYSSADERAYYGYLSGGWIETVDSYEYGGTSFPSVTCS